MATNQDTPSWGISSERQEEVPKNQQQTHWRDDANEGLTRRQKYTETLEQGEKDPNEQNSLKDPNGCEKFTQANVECEYPEAKKGDTQVRRDEGARRPHREDTMHMTAAANKARTEHQDLNKLPWRDVNAMDSVPWKDIQNDGCSAPTTDHSGEDAEQRMESFWNQHH